MQHVRWEADREPKSHKNLSIPSSPHHVTSHHTSCYHRKNIQAMLSTPLARDLMPQALSSHIYTELPSTFTVNTGLFYIKIFSEVLLLFLFPPLPRNGLQDISQQLSSFPEA